MLPTETTVIHRLFAEGIPIAEIARRLGRSRQTIYNRLERDPESAEPTRRPSKLDPYRAYIRSRLERFNVPATVLLREIREKGYTGGISILRDFVASIKDQQVNKLVERFETEPGRQAQVDWASCGTILHEGRRRRLSLLVVVLGHSRMIWAQFVVSERRPVLMELLESAFQALGGVPRELVFDNLKAVIAEARTEDRPARVQPGFQAFAEHWGFEVIACPPYWPRAKGKVERAIQYIEQSFLEGRSFEDLDDLNRQLTSFLHEIANVRDHGTTRERPIDRLIADQEGMLPLVSTVFPSQQVSQRLADWDARISFGGVRYSVDPEILGPRRGTLVEVHVGTDQRLRIFHEGALVGNHAVVSSGSPPQDDPLHARARRKLRERPAIPKRTAKVLFDQTETASDLPDAPIVSQTPLQSYEVATCSPG